MELHGKDDAALMVMAGEGSRDAFAELVRRHQQSLLNFFRHMGAYTDEAEDLVQETFVRLFAYRSRYEPMAKFTALLYTLARHVWADRLRKSMRTPEVSVETADERALAADDHAPGVERRLDIREALSRLSGKLRAVVVLNVYQGLRFQEVADVLDIPLGTVKSRMFLALRELKELLDGGPEQK